MLHFGFSYIGFIYLLLLFIPNVIWSKHQPKDYEKYVVNENRVLLLMERTGEVLVCCFALIFSDFNIQRISLWSLWLGLSFLLMLFYECYWIRYFKSEKTMADFYSSFCGIPLAGATLPVMAFFFLSIYGVNFPLLISVVILGIGHIGIHRAHYKEISRPKESWKAGCIPVFICRWIGIIAAAAILLFVLTIIGMKNITYLIGIVKTGGAKTEGMSIESEAGQPEKSPAESEAGQTEVKPADAGPAAGESGQKEIVDDTVIEERILELAPQIMAGDDVDIEDVDIEKEGIPYQMTEVSFYDITGDGKQELFVYIEPSEGGWWSDPNEGAIYVIAQDDNENYLILSKNWTFRSGYTQLLAADGTEIWAAGYSSASSWKGGSRFHLGYREGQIVVDSIERYGFHWDLPVINKVYDYRQGLFQVYAGRNPDEGKTEGYGDYIPIEKSIKIDEETFESRLIPFTDYVFERNLYPDVYSNWSPFSEDWWQDGGRYPEEGEESGSGIAYWIEDAAGDKPDEMLAEAVAQSGLQLEKKAYPWTEETKANVMELLRCPVADYYYISEEYGAAYMRGEVCFYEKNISEFNGSEWWRELKE